MPFIVTYPPGLTPVGDDRDILRDNRDIAADLVKGLVEGKSIACPTGWSAEWIGPQLYFMDGDGI